MAKRLSRYSRYTGGPDPLAPPVDLRDALEQIGQDVMEGSSPRRALQELLRRGTQNQRGADRLAAEANSKRRKLLQRNNLDGTLQDIKKLLDEAGWRRGANGIRQKDGVELKFTMSTTAGNVARQGCQAAPLEAFASGPAGPSLRRAQRHFGFGGLRPL